MSSLFSASLGILLSVVPAFAGGSFDETFGNGGRVLLPVSAIEDPFNASSEALEVAVQSDGKILVAGRSHGKMAIARIHADGSRDPDFGTRGLVIVPIEEMEDASIDSLIVTRDRILAVGSAKQVGPGVQSYDFVLARFLNDGTLDFDFGKGGVVVTDFSRSRDHFSSDEAFGAAAFSDGSILVAGESRTRKNSFALARYRENGQIDESFGKGGKLLLELGEAVLGRKGLLIHFADGEEKIVLAGAIERKFTVLRLNRDGSVDRRFGSRGMVRTDFGTSYPSVASAIAALPDGRLVAAGWAGLLEGSVVALAQLSEKGLDAGFGHHGQVLNRFGQGQNDLVFQDRLEARAVKVQADGKIVVAGIVNDEIFVSRYLSDGKLDPSFAEGGRLITGFGAEVGQKSRAAALALQTDGRIVVSGAHFDPLAGRYEFATACITK